MFYVNKAPRITVADVLAEMSKVVLEDHPITLRLLEISAHRIVNIVDNDINADCITTTNSPNSKIFISNKMFEASLEPRIPTKPDENFFCRVLPC